MAFGIGHSALVGVVLVAAEGRAWNLVLLAPFVMKEKANRRMSNKELRMTK
jgi:hypothetical protein